MLIGIDSLYYAVLTDTVNELYGTPRLLLGVNTIEITPNTGNAEYFADNGLYESLPFVSSVDIALTLAEINVKDRAVLLGSTHSEGVVIESNNNIAPYVAIGFRSLKSNGSYVYVWYFRGKFKIPSETLGTKKAETELQDLSIEGTFYSKGSNTAYRKYADEDDPFDNSDAITHWFDSVDGEDTVSPVLLSILPTNGAINVALDSVIYLTFSEDIKVSTIDNITLNDGASVAITNTVDERVVTITPDADLTTSTLHTVTIPVTVTDLFDNPIAVELTKTFTTV